MEASNNMPRKKVLTKEERKGEESFATHKEIVDNEKKIRTLLVRNIDLYANMFESQGYKDILGDERGEWAGYLGQLEVYRTRSEVNRWLKIKDRLVDEFSLTLEDLLDVPVTRIGDIAYVAESATDSQDLLSLARTLSSSDWKDEMHKRTGKHTRDDGHKHDSVLVKICRQCGNKERVQS